MYFHGIMVIFPYGYLYYLINRYFINEGKYVTTAVIIIAEIRAPTAAQKKDFLLLRYK